MGTSDTSWSGSEGLFLRYNDAIVIDVVTFLRIIFFNVCFLTKLLTCISCIKVSGECSNRQSEQVLEYSMRDTVCQMLEWEYFSRETY